jgi:D-alanyl-lipoteichoic acid acyltransferase DltB (MBOAT superfamily)
LLFNSLAFLIFLPAVLALYYGLPARLVAPMLLAASYYFYGSWSVGFLFLLMCSSLVDYLVGLRMQAAPESRRLWLAFSLATNLGLLGLFKYWDFLASSLNAVLPAGGPVLPLLGLVLPVGISFYTFQSLGYTIDVYRGVIPAERRLERFALYVAYFPQLVAGPIERPENLLPQLAERRIATCEQVRTGLRLMLWGFFKKVVVADRLALLVDAVYGSGGPHSALVWLVATYAFAFQIYCDFSGYTDIARGVARLMGVELMLNFDVPYLSRSIAEFWRRWHISLSTWFRDYVYVSLGGNRVSPDRRYLNVFIVFLLSGLWHGANWTFVVWGAFHGVCVVLGALTRPLRDRLWGRWAESRTRHLLSIAITFHLACLGWVLFRARDLSQAREVFVALAGLPGAVLAYVRGLPVFVTTGHSSLALLALASASVVVFAGEWVYRQVWFRAMFEARPRIRLGLYAAVFYGTLFLGYFGETAFIYFQF